MLPNLVILTQKTATETIEHPLAADLIRTSTQDLDIIQPARAVASGDRLCEVCRRVNIDAVRDRCFRLHDNLIALKVSAEAGCRLCKLLWTCLITQVNANNIEKQLCAQSSGAEGRVGVVTDTAIWLQGELHDVARYDANKLPENQIWVYSGGENDETAHFKTDVFARLSVYAPLDDPSARFLKGREVYADPADETRFRMVKRWLSHCDNHHSCRGDEPPVLPSRVIDVGPPDSTRDPILLITQGLRGQYIALSYCWGRSQRVVTTRATLDAFARGIDISTLARSPQDAIFVARKLGIQYLWIDALCIVQQEVDLTDFKVESVKMAQYYGDAYFTLVAASAGDCGEGFLVPRPSSPAQACRLDYSRPRRDSSPPLVTGTVFACLPTGVAPGPVATRGWTLQEMNLSRRVVEYGPQQMSFKCSQRTVYENGVCKPSQSVIKCNLHSPRYPWPSFDAFAQGWDPSEQKAFSFRRWNNMLEEYTRRSITDPTDKFTAVSGMAQRTQHKVECRYLCGLWEDDLIRGLLWTRAIIKEGKWRRAINVRRMDLPNVPSWSWASVAGPIEVEHGERAEHKYRGLENVQVQIFLYSSTLDSFDPVRAETIPRGGNGLKIQGVLKAVQFASEGPLPDLADQLRKFNASQQFAYTVNLSPLEASHSHDGLGQAVVTSVVARALFDWDDVPPLTSAWCVRLIRLQGLLLQSNGDGGYQRVGTFLVLDEAWFSDGDSEEFMLH